jgi:hypothetical protein
MMGLSDRCDCPFHALNYAAAPAHVTGRHEVELHARYELLRGDDQLIYSGTLFNLGLFDKPLDVLVFAHYFTPL